jgi:hypothetical protein
MEINEDHFIFLAVLRLFLDDYSSLFCVVTVKFWLCHVARFHDHAFYCRQFNFFLKSNWEVEALKLTLQAARKYNQQRFTQHYG